MTLHIRKDAPAYTVEQLTGLAGKPSSTSDFEPSAAAPTTS